MQLYEIDKNDLRKHKSITEAIAAGDYIIRDDQFIVSAFNFGNGTKKDMNRYMKDNSVFCIWIDANTMQRVSKV